MATHNGGLTWQRTTDAIRTFVRQYGSMAPRRAAFCTFDFGVERFEAVVLPELLRRGRQFRTIVAADAGALQTQLREIGDRRLGRYQVAPVRCTRGGVFHPKVIFLSAGPRRLVGVGSANLTSGGLGGNLELMLFADDAGEFGRQFVGGAARFLDRLLMHGSTQMPASAREFIRTMLAGTPRVPDTILDSLDVPLLQQMVHAHFGGTRRRATQRLTILSPWHSSGASPDGVSPAVLSQLRSSFKPDAAAVFTDGLNHTGPALGRGVAVHIRGDAVKTAIEPDDVDDEPERVLNRRPTRVHAKAYLAEAAAGGGTLFFGSANCTQPALLRSASKGGNVEILVMSVLDQRAVQAFRADLKDLFQPARSTIAIAPAAAPARPAGDILAGNLLNRHGGVHLELEAPSIQRGDVFVSRHAQGPRLRVPVRAGIGRVTQPARISALFGGSVPDRESDTWACVLWERLGTRAVPFPVSIPLLATGSDSPEAVLRDLVLEELGIWPAENGEGTTDEEVPEVKPEDQDLEALAAAEHEGRLDRIAVSIAVLRRRILNSRAGRQYADERMHLLHKQVAKLDVAPHVKKVLLEHINPSRRGRRAPK